ncbi:hypothetical protein DFJ73DRAFT_798754 [Zopfochytrium polystomum]|nr:hypothetical protein DFJ73DRAFT_798754 [Zopfochytrium polystomum]
MAHHQQQSRSSASLKSILIAIVAAAAFAVVLAASPAAAAPAADTKGDAADAPPAPTSSANVISIAGTTVSADPACKVLGQNKKIKTWRLVYDPCYLLAVTSLTCVFDSTPGRNAYDIVWEARKVLGYDCGKSQYKYKGNRWETICDTIKTATSIEDLYLNKVKCTKYVPPAAKKSKGSKKSAKGAAKKDDTKEEKKKKSDSDDAKPDKEAKGDDDSAAKKPKKDADEPAAGGDASR